jgi:hypothetical protein
MSISINIPSSLEHCTGKIKEVEVAGATVGECLNDLVKKYPDIKCGLFDKYGKLLKALDIWVNMESSFPLELLRPVNDGNILYITGNGGS